MGFAATIYVQCTINLEVGPVGEKFTWNENFVP
jgi:hypothetical protein